jgi:hemoglobin
MNATFEPRTSLPDLDNRDQVERFVRRFYRELLRDPVLAPIFLDVAEVDLDAHLPHIVDYWCKLLLGDSSYDRHTMNIHRRLHAKRQLAATDFERWLGYFTRAVDSGWRGENADRAKRIATTIAANMARSLDVSD